MEKNNPRDPKYLARLKEIDSFPQLLYFFNCYMHQDWKLDSPDVAHVLEQFAKLEGPETTKRLRKEFKVAQMILLGAPLRGSFYEK